MRQMLNLIHYAIKKGFSKTIPLCTFAWRQSIFYEGKAVWNKLNKKPFQFKRLFYDIVSNAFPKLYYRKYKIEYIIFYFAVIIRNRLIYAMFWMGSDISWIRTILGGLVCITLTRPGIKDIKIHINLSTTKDNSFQHGI